jgi:SPP1 gp7 family putative phage head morphogenesis protein
MPAKKPTRPPADLDRFEEAVDAWRRKVPVPDQQWKTLTAEERRHAFTVAGVTQARVVQQVYDALGQAIADGTTLDDFQENIGGVLSDAWGGPDSGRIETIFRTGTMQSYNEGRQAVFSHPAVREARPFIRYDAVGDARSCPACDPLDGLVLPADDPFWKKHQPPLHPNCFPPGTPVLCPGGWRAIETLAVGDQVIAHDGRPRPVLRCFERSFQGVLVAIKGPAGQVAYPTPNHPLGTERGWVAAERLDVQGDRLWVFQDVPPVPDHAPPVREDLLFHGAIVGRLASGAVPLSAVELDHELHRWYGDVGVPFPQRQPDDVLDAKTAQRLGDRDLVLAARLVLAGSRPRLELRHRGSSAAQGGVCRRHLVLLSLLVHAGIAARIVLRDRTHHSSTGEDARDRDAAAREAPGERDRGLSADVEADDFLLRQVQDPGHGFELESIHVGTRSFRGVVYNLEVAGSPTYVAGGFLVHNCRCIHTSLSPDEAIDEGVSDEAPHAEPPADGFGRPADFEPDLSAFSPAIARALKDKLG